MTVMRSVFYVPANTPRFIQKAPEFAADIVTLDLEDAVPRNLKAEARELARANLKHIASNGAQAYVRLNSYDTGMTDDDLDAIVCSDLDGVCLAKTTGAEDVERLDAALTKLEKERGVPAGQIKISILLETAKGILNAGAACQASPRVVSAIFGTVDFCRDMRLNRTAKGIEQSYARASVGIAARAAGIVALDGPFADYKDMDMFKENLLDGKQMYGFEGRMIIHPSQIAAAHELYSPTAEEVEHARKVKVFFEED